MRCHCLILLCVLASTVVLANTERTKADLDQVQNELKSTTQKITEQKEQISRLEAALKEADLAISNSAKSIKKINFGIELNENEQFALKQKIDELQNNKNQQQSALAAQLKSAYMTGSHDYGKLLLSQDQVANVERTLNYYTFLNKARINELEKLKRILLELEQTKNALIHKQVSLINLKAEQEQQRKLLVSAKSDQEENLKKLKQTLASDQSQLAYLQQNERILKQTLEELAQASLPAEISLAGLQARKGRLNWPSRGKVRRKFGQRKHGSLRWKGVLINANEGSSVKTIADGQIVYADWLKGFGWVMIIDHGEGYMSLYGHNQALLKEVGDKVTQGEMIALVGQSGGQANPSLYFEIRHKGRAVNPIKWCRRI